MNYIPVNKGSTLTTQVTWGTSGDLTGFTVEAYDVSPAITGLITVTLASGPARTIDVVIAWDEKIPLGNSECYFRIRVVSPSGVAETTPLLHLDVQ